MQFSTILIQLNVQQQIKAKIVSFIHSFGFSICTDFICSRSRFQVRHRFPFESNQIHSILFNSRHSQPHWLAERIQTHIHMCNVESPNIMKFIKKNTVLETVHRIEFSFRIISHFEFNSWIQAALIPHHKDFRCVINILVVIENLNFPALKHLKLQ